MNLRRITTGSALLVCCLLPLGCSENRSQGCRVSGVASPKPHVFTLCDEIEIGMSREELVELLDKYDFYIKKRPDAWSVWPDREGVEKVIMGTPYIYIQFDGEGRVDCYAPMDI